MLRIREIEWNWGQGLYDLSIHGVGPTKAMAEHLAGIIEGSVDNVDPGVRDQRGKLTISMGYLKFPTTHVDSLSGCLSRIAQSHQPTIPIRNKKRPIP